MKQLYFTSILLVLVFAANSQNKFAQEMQQKMKTFSQKFPSQQLKSIATDAYALDSITYENGEVKKMTYDTDGQLLTFKSFKNETDQIILYETETNTYNESGQMLTNLVKRYSDWTNQLEYEWKYENTYTSQGRPLTEIEWLAENEAPYALEYDSKTTYDYVDDKTIETMSYDWDNGEWQLNYKQKWFVRWGTETYPMVDSLHIYILVEGTSNTWFRVGDMTFISSADGLMSEEYIIGYDDETGEQSYKMKTVTTYNAMGYILMETTEKYNLLTTEWELISKTEYEYNSDNQIIREEDFSFNYLTETFGPNYKMTYEYDADGNLKKQQEYLTYGDEELVLSYKNEFTFKSLNTENIMLPSNDIGYFGYDTDFYDAEFYKNGAIDEVKHYSYSYYESEQDEMLEKTGKYYYSKFNSTETSIEQPNTASIKVFPNPFSNEINITLDKAEKCQLKIRNSTGQVVYSANINGTTTSHNVSELPSGLYIMSVFHDGENMNNYKLVKE